MTNPTWWKEGIIYQIYPRSFQDTNGDGIGDLAGIAARLDYLVWLGADAIWISPIYPSPMADFGYDISDYCDVDPLFGSLHDFDHLVEEAHRRNLKVILDYVPNHTSDQHAWFAESRASRSNPKRDWYYWKDPNPDGGPPNNWISNFGGSAWELDPGTGQYYYHAFLKQQPDLNWRNSEVVAAMSDVLRFWMRRGVDGFRVDVLWHLMKDAEWRDNPPNPAFREGQPDIERLLQVHSADQPEVHGIVQHLRRVVDEFPDRVLIGEIYLPIDRLVTYYGRDLSGAHLPFNFQLIQSAWIARQLAALIREYEAALPAGGWPNWVLGNHDKPRIASRIGRPQARVAAMLLLTLRGTPTLYYGDEIGMENVSIPADQVQDPWEKNEPGLGFNRDPQRTPMQWGDEENAGFTIGKPWLPLELRFRERNVKAFAADRNSILVLYRRLIALRRRHKALTIGSYREVESEGDVLAHERAAGGEVILVALNLGREAQRLKARGRGTGQVLLSTLGSREGEAIHAEIEIGPDEGLVIGYGAAADAGPIEADPPEGGG